MRSQPYYNQKTAHNEYIKLITMIIQTKTNIAIIRNQPQITPHFGVQGIQESSRHSWYATHNS